MTSYLSATSISAWPSDKFAEFSSAPPSPSSDTALQLSNALLESSQPSTPSSQAFPSTPPLPFLNAAAATEQPWNHKVDLAPPMISTFSTSASSQRQIHFVQPYLQSDGRPSDLVKKSQPRQSGMADSRPRRPANAWILYRSEKMKTLKPSDPSAPRRTQADISRIIAALWRDEAPAVRMYYETLSDHYKAEHLAQYPTYRFQPSKKVDKVKGRTSKKAEKAALRAERGISSRRSDISAATPLKELLVNEQVKQEPLDAPSGVQLPTWRAAPPASHAYGSGSRPVPIHHSSSGMREPLPVGEQSVRRLEPYHVIRPALPSINTGFQATSMNSSAANEMATAVPSTQSTTYWPEHSAPSSTFTHHTIHSDHSYPYESPITVCVCHYESSSFELISSPYRPATSTPSSTLLVGTRLLRITTTLRLRLQMSSPRSLNHITRFLTIHISTSSRTQVPHSR